MQWHELEDGRRRGVDQLFVMPPYRGFVLITMACKFAIALASRRVSSRFGARSASSISTLSIAAFEVSRAVESSDGAMSNNMDVDHDGAQPEQQLRSTSPLAFPSSSAGGHPSSDARPANVDRLRSAGAGGEYSRSHLDDARGLLTLANAYSPKLVTTRVPFLLERRFGPPCQPQPAVQLWRASFV